MKILVVLTLLASSSAFADFVYMKETAQGKSILWNKNNITTVLNDTQTPEWAIYPDIASNGQEFIYSEGAGPADLHLTYVNIKKGTKQRFFLSHKGMLLHPQFSGNTKYIFYSAPNSSGKNTIYFFNREKLVAAQGVGLEQYSLKDVQALDEAEEAYFPRPSSDGGFVVYQRNTAETKEIVLFDRITGKKKVLGLGMSPALSSDERLVAFTRKTDSNWNVHVIDRFTGEEKQLTNDSFDEMAPTFTPQNEIVFASNKSGHFALYRLGTENWELITGDQDADFYSPQFSGDSSFNQGELAPFIGNARSSFGTINHEGKVYMAGGHQGAEHTYPPESFTDTFNVYDTETKAWTELAPRPCKAHGYQLAAHGNYIYAFGGFAYSEKHKPAWKSLDTIDRYDIKLNQWTTVGKLQSPRSSNVAVTINDKVYVVGGWDATPKFENDYDGKFHEVIEVFDLKTETIQEASFKLPQPLRRAFTGIMYKDHLVLIGGLGIGASHFELLNTVTLINPTNGIILEWPTLPFATFAPAAGMIGEELFVFGGMFKTGAMDYEYVSHIYGFKTNEGAWKHTGRYLQETKGFSQVIPLQADRLGILGGHHYSEGEDRPVRTFETFGK